MMVFRHRRFGVEGTLAIKLPDDLSNNFDLPTTLHIGFALKHPKDAFCKKIGREMAQSYIVPVEAELLTVDKIPAGFQHTYTAVLSKKYKNFKLFISFSKENDVVKFKHAHVEVK